MKRTLLLPPFYIFVWSCLAGGCSRGPAPYEDIMGYELPSNAVLNVHTVSRMRDSEHYVFIRFAARDDLQVFLRDGKFEELQGAQLYAEIQAQLNAAWSQMKTSEYTGPEITYDRILSGQSANKAFRIYAGVCSNEVLCVIR